MIEATGPDSLRFFLTGADEHNGVQEDASASKGAYASSTELECVRWVRDAVLTNVTVDYVSESNGPGTGFLEATGSSTVRWSAPGGSPGTEVTIANGETLVVADGDDQGKFVRVTRTSGTALSGTTSVVISDRYEDVVGMASVTSAQRTAGIVIYRLIAMRNVVPEAGVSLKDLSLWLEPAYGVEVGPSVYTTMLGSSGSGTVLLSSGVFSGWATAGWAKIVKADGTVREVVYYTSRTATALTVPSAGRALCGTSSTAMLATDVLVPWTGRAFAVEEPNAQPDGHFNGNAITDPVGLTWRHAQEDGDYTWGDLENGEQLGLWLRWDVPAGATATPSTGLVLPGVAFDAVPG